MSLIREINLLFDEGLLLNFAPFHPGHFLFVFLSELLAYGFNQLAPSLLELFTHAHLGLSLSHQKRNRFFKRV
jgi:hypothetical protein